MLKTSDMFSEKPPDMLFKQVDGDCADAKT